MSKTLSFPAWNSKTKKPDGQAKIDCDQVRSVEAAYLGGEKGTEGCVVRMKSGNVALIADPDEVRSAVARARSADQPAESSARIAQVEKIPSEAPADQPRSG